MGNGKSKKTYLIVGLGRFGKALSIGLMESGAHEIVSPEAEMGHRIADWLENPWMRFFSEFGDDDRIIGKLRAPEDMVVKTLKELALPTKYGTILLV